MTGSIVAPAGTVPGARLKASSCGGRSESLAMARKVNREPSSMAVLGIAASCGARSLHSPSLSARRPSARLPLSVATVMA